MLDIYLPIDLRTLTSSELDQAVIHPEDYSALSYAELCCEAARRKGLVRESNDTRPVDGRVANATRRGPA